MPTTKTTPLTRKQVLTQLAEEGYAGPTSYLLPVLRDVAVWVQAGSPAKTSLTLPPSVLRAVHPEAGVQS